MCSGLNYQIFSKRFFILIEKIDINFDYGYGYDYERVIKDRLKIANSELRSEPIETNKQKSTLVSFDNAVTAFDIPSESEAESGIIEPNDSNLNKTNLNGGPTESTATTNNLSSSINLSKLPLNDTVQKDNPDSFANKLREAIMRFDNEQQQQLEKQYELYNNTQSNNNLNSQNNKSTVQTSKPNHQPSTNLKPIQFNSNGSKSPSPILNQNSPDLTGKTVNNEKKNHKVLHIISTADESADISINDELLNNGKSNNNLDTNKLRISSPPSSNSNNSFDSPRNNNNNKPFSFSAIKDENTENENNKNNQNSLLNSQEDKNNKKLSEQPASEKMLIEKDGVFELMSQEEYTAYEKKKALENKNRINSGNNTSKKSIFIPHPPPAKTRPKTSNYDNRKANLIKSRYVIPPSNPSNNSSLNNTEKVGKQQQSLIRISHSADAASRSKHRNKSYSPISNHRTPEYAQNYKSPYQLTTKIYKPIET
jgi:hypothetical protein